MQDAPDAARLLAAMADTLEERVLGELAGSAQHQARVVANLCRVLAREHELDPALDAAARAALAALLDTDGSGPGDPAGTTAELWEACAARIDRLGDTPEDDALAARAHGVLTEIVAGKVAVAKPDYLRAP